MKKLVLLFFFLIIGIIYLRAQEVITFTWKGNTTKKDFCVEFTSDNEFTVDWGDGNITTYISEERVAWIFQPTVYSNNEEYRVTITSETNISFSGLLIDNKLVTSLDVSQASELTWLACPNNEISELNLRNNTKLDNLVCESNLLSKLDLTQNPKLKDLACSYNSLTSLDLSKNPKLETVTCRNNYLTELDVSHNTSLILCGCDNNIIPELDFSKNKKLDDLSCGNNSLVKLNVSQCKELRWLYCSDNFLVDLDLSWNSKLFELRCHENTLTSLDLSRNKQLAMLTCYNNSLPLWDLYIASLQIAMAEFKLLGTQRLPIQTIQTNKPLLLLNNMILNEMHTVFSITKDGSPATDGIDYELNYQDQNISFLKNGNYVLTMTNPAIDSEPDYPVQVIMPVIVSDYENINIVEQSSLVIYPNPTSDYIKISDLKGKHTLRIVDSTGKQVLSQEICSDELVDITHLNAGMYILHIDSRTIKLIVK